MSGYNERFRTDAYILSFFRDDPKFLDQFRQDFWEHVRRNPDAPREQAFQEVLDGLRQNMRQNLGKFPELQNDYVESNYNALSGALINVRYAMISEFDSGNRHNASFFNNIATNALSAAHVQVPQINHAAQFNFIKAETDQLTATNVRELAQRYGNIIAREAREVHTSLNNDMQEAGLLAHLSGMVAAPGWLSSKDHDTKQLTVVMNEIRAMIADGRIHFNTETQREDISNLAHSAIDVARQYQGRS